MPREAMSLGAVTCELGIAEIGPALADLATQEFFERRIS